MIKINLLPEKEMRQLRLLRIRRFILKRVLVLSFLGLLVVLGLGALDWFLRKNLAEINSQTEAKMQEVDTANFLKLKAKIDRFNQNLEVVAKLQAQQVGFSPFLVELVRLTPPEVRLESLQIKAADGSGQMRGVAARREDLLQFQEDLAKSSFLSELDSPLSNLTERDNVEFQVKFKVSPEALKFYE